MNVLSQAEPNVRYCFYEKYQKNYLLCERPCIYLAVKGYLTVCWVQFQCTRRQDRYRSGNRDIETNGDRSAWRQRQGDTEKWR